MALNTTPRTWTTGEIVTAAELNAEIRDAIKGLQSSWPSYIPSWVSSGTAPSVGNGSLTGNWNQIGKTIFWRIRLDFGSTTSAGTGTYAFTLPVAPLSGYAARVVGDATVQVGSTFYARTAVTSGSYNVLAVDANGARVGAGTPVTFASGNAIELAGTYETG